MTDDVTHPAHRPDVADLLADRFPGHTMQRLRTADGKYRYIYVSSGVQNSFGLDPDQLMQSETVDHAWVHPEDRQRFIDELERSARDLTPLDTEVRVESPSGTYRWVRSLGQPRRQPDGATIWDGVALDITDRREALEALERALAEARRSEVTEGRFAYIAAQDLAGPLSVLRRAVSDLQSIDLSGAPGIADRVSSLASGFATFEKALFATKDLVASGTTRSNGVAAGPESNLTKRQAEILAQVRRGASNRAIADNLGIAEGCGTEPKPQGVDLAKQAQSSQTMKLLVALQFVQKRPLATLLSASAPPVLNTFLNGNGCLPTHRDCSNEVQPLAVWAQYSKPPISPPQRAMCAGTCLSPSTPVDPRPKDQLCGPSL